MKLLRRNLSLMLAVRYLNPLRTAFSVITLICTLGVALGVMVLIVVLSVMEGLQKEVDDRVLAFTPHLQIALLNEQGRTCINLETCDWRELTEKIATVPGVICAYPQLDGQGSVSANHILNTVTFSALQPENNAQIGPISDMIIAGSSDLGAGYDPICIISTAAANSLGLSVGDTLTLTPLAGGLERAGRIYSMIQEPLITQQDETFKQAISQFFDGAASTAEGLMIPADKLSATLDILYRMPEDRMRPGEIEGCSKLTELAQSHTAGTPFSQAEQQTWNNTVAALASLDRDKEDGRAAKSINDMVMPTDLEIVGIYQTPENLPGPGIYLPLTIAQDAIGYSQGGLDQVQGICVRLTDPNNYEPAMNAIEAILPDLSAATDEHPLGLSWSIQPWSDRLKQWHDLIANERVMLSFVLSIISLIASFCIMAVMFTVSMQRKREIAVLQALGATPGKIVGIFAWQGIIIGLLGAVLGVVLALLVLYYRLEIQAALAGIGLDPFPMQGHGIELPAVYDPATFSWQAFKAFVMVIIASTVPAIVVSRQDPSRALRAN